MKMRSFLLSNRNKSSHCGRNGFFDNKQKCVPFKNIDEAHVCQYIIKANTGSVFVHSVNNKPKMLPDV